MAVDKWDQMVIDAQRERKINLSDRSTWPPPVPEDWTVTESQAKKIAAMIFAKVRKGKIKRGG